MSLATRSRSIMRDSVVGTAVLALIEAGLALALGYDALARGVLLATPVTAAWLMAIIRAVEQTLTSAIDGAEEAPRPRRGSLLGLAKLPALALALTCILWYMPARPEGVALGVLNGLLALVFAAKRHTRPPPN